MTREQRRILASFALVLTAACTSSSPEAAKPSEQASASSVEQPATGKAESAPPVAPNVVEPEVVEPEVVEPGGTLPQAEPVEPPPAFAPVPSDPTSDPLRVVLSSGKPETVDIVAVHELGKRRIVLYQVDVAEQWEASRPADDPLLERLEQGYAKCEEEDDAPTPLRMCFDEFARSAGVPGEIAVHLAGGTSKAWELAHVEFDAKGRARILARKRLYDYGFAIETELVETKLKVYDMDGDKRSEILVVFAVAPDTEELYEQIEAGLAFVLDKTDLHIQYATTRNYWDEFSDVSSSTIQIDTAFVVRDENDDGHGDLVVREHKVHDDYPGEDDEDDARPTKDVKDRSTVCLYVLADDAWSCPEWLGTEMIDGSKVIERTAVPVILAPKPGAPAKD